ncbi:unnamed protein product [Heligmosomoides polygyrus]|uniref:Anaphase-promoting complex subunit 1 n=1 Tax=Heligmosomoides polygyrus TaxID=6339 RepID=A0A183G862_HELPZ|nr:unnamed protein product [Heligmosomoides polygyrus]
MDCFITDEYGIEPFRFSDFLSDIISPQPCLPVDPASPKLRCDEFERADQWTVLRGNRLIRHDLRICDKALVATLNKDIVNLCFGVPAIKRGEVAVTCSKFGVHDGEVIMTAVAVFRCSDVTIKITCHNNHILRWYIRCLLIKQGPELEFGLLGTACLRSIRRKEMPSSLQRKTGPPRLVYRT